MSYIIAMIVEPSHGDCPCAINELQLLLIGMAAAFGVAWIPLTRIANTSLVVGGAAVILNINVCTHAGAAVLTEEPLVVRYPVGVVQAETEGDRGLLAWFLVRFLRRLFVRLL